MVDRIAETQICVNCSQDCILAAIFNKLFSMKTEKKCPHCGVWTEWNKQPTDRCSNCNELLDQRSLDEKIERERHADEAFANDYLRIREDDGFMMRIVRRAAWVVHLIFAAITWFFLWMVATTPG